MNRKMRTSVAAAMLGSALAMVLAAAFSFTLLGGEVARAEADPVIKTLSVVAGYELVEKNRNNPDFIIVDVRTNAEFQDGHLENALNYDVNSDGFRDDIDKLDKSKTYFVYCRSGSRSALAVEVMAELGFTEIFNLGGGYEQWELKGYPVAR